MFKQVLAVAGLTLSLISATSAGPIYNAADDFSASSNPNGVWSYGQYTSGVNPASFLIYSTPNDLGNVLGPSAAGLDAWYNSPVDPNVIKNVTNSTIVLGTNTWTAGELSLGPFGGPTLVRFTAPATGMYEISALFTPSQTDNTAPTGSVLENALVLGSGSTASTFSYTSAGAVSLTIGDHIDFVASSGTKTTRLDATITAVPEPASLVLLGSAGLALLRAAGRRRRG